MSLVDLLPTLHAVAGGSPEMRVADCDGESLFELDDARSESRVVHVEHLEGATAAPRVMVRRGRYKYVHSEAYPPQLYDLDDDPDERRDLAAEASAAEIRASMQALVAERWDLSRLAREVATDTRARRFVADALALGRVERWEREPTVGTADRFVRRGDLFPEVERRGYLDYPGHPGAGGDAT